MRSGTFRGSCKCAPCVKYFVPNRVSVTPSIKSLATSNDTRLRFKAMTNHGKATLCNLLLLQEEEEEGFYKAKVMKHLFILTRCKLRLP